MKRKYLAFDIETAKMVEDESDWRSCSTSGNLLCGNSPLGFRRVGPVARREGSHISGGPNEQEEAVRLVQYLETQVECGYTIVTWNGIGFDFDILAEESGMLAGAGNWR